MRLVQVYVPSSSREAVTDELDDAGVDWVVNGERDGGAVLAFPLPTGAVEDVLGRTRDAGLDEDDFTVVAELRAASSPNLADLEDEYVEGPRHDDRVANAELQETAQSLKSDVPVFVSLAALSAVVAAVGLLLNSAIIIVGAMVLSPFTGSAFSVSVGAVVDDGRLLRESLAEQLSGVAVATVAAAAFAWLLRWGQFVPAALDVTRVGQMGAFSDPGSKVLAVAACAGAAGALALATDFGVSLAGVAAAAAMVPSAAAAGVGFVWGAPALGVDALVLLTLNVALINASSYLGFRALGYGSGVLRERDRSALVGELTAARVVATLLVVAVVATSGMAAYQQVDFERTTNGAVSETLDRPRYATLSLVAVDVESPSAAGALLSPFTGYDPTRRVSVVLVRTAGREYPALAERLHDRIVARTDEDVTVTVQFVRHHRADGAETTAADRATDLGATRHAGPAAPF